jgi:hypothetical protein
VQLCKYLVIEGLFRMIEYVKGPDPAGDRKAAQQKNKYGPAKQIVRPLLRMHPVAGAAELYSFHAILGEPKEN